MSPCATTGRTAFAGLALICFTAGLALALAAAGDGVLPGDVDAARWVQSWDGALPDRLAELGNWLGAFWTGVVIAMPVFGGLLIVRRWAAALLLLALTLIRVTNNTVKEVIESPRPTPDLVRVTERLDSLGFPSGHAFGAMLLYGALAYLAVQFIRSAGPRRLAVALSLLIIPLVGFGRIHTGAHWPSDVLGGYLWGAAVLCILIAVLRPGRANAAAIQRGVRAGR